MSISAKAIVWDVDGVLLRSGDGTYRLYSETVQQKLGIDAKIFHEKLWDGRFEPCLVGKRDSAEMIREALEEIGKEQHLDWYLNHWLDCADEVNQEAFVLKNSVDLPHYLGTNQCKTRGAYFWEELGFNKEFEGMFASGFLGERKPTAAFFEIAHAGIASKQGDVQPQEVIFFDDMLENVEAAKRFGWQAFHFKKVSDAAQALRALGLV